MFIRVVWVENVSQVIKIDNVKVVEIFARNIESLFWGLQLFAM